MCPKCIKLVYIYNLEVINEKNKYPLAKCNARSCDPPIILTNTLLFVNDYFKAK